MSLAPTAIFFERGALLDGMGLPYEGVREMVAALSAAGYPLGIVGGTARKVGDVLATASFELEVAEARALPAAAERLGMPVERVAVVGASPSVLAAARAAGMSTGLALWVTEAGDADTAWRFDRPADVTLTFARWC